MLRSWEDKYYILIGSGPRPRTRLHLVGKPSLPDIESRLKLADRLRNLYPNVLGPSLFEKRNEARAFASYRESLGFENVVVCAVVPLRKFVREPNLAPSLAWPNESRYSQGRNE